MNTKVIYEFMNNFATNISICFFFVAKIPIDCIFIPIVQIPVQDTSNSSLETDFCLDFYLYEVMILCHLHCLRVFCLNWNVKLILV